MVIYLIGVHHSIQHNGGNLRNIPGLFALREQFQYYLISTTREFGISVLAEELNEDALKMFNASESLARFVAGRLGIAHMFCEPSLRARSSLGFTKQLQKKHHFIRELLWYDKMIDYKGKRIVFICGVNHIPTFSRLIQEKGQHAIILTSYYGRNFFESLSPHRFYQSLTALQKNSWVIFQDP
uniref:Uncharacterized protein n=2 Tax=unclassified Candidatus Kentrum TaxID=2643149 RepID=A0A451ARZ0_9GAMM|nr:MAG: hypothetical protein BECKLPF1236B_GA0070989_108313 [Candidatus Kentron sp. LPFa]VFK68755.1 MAG: hypothetical protein BECKUNK1418G_GA0071005_12662 [Candidatus Kentron sp. UNK]VFK73714.1 MAG: hypothetical protein BECKUNK1418H_GA0071006_12594 [Candidatus Kentron sp. UNK]